MSFDIGDVVRLNSGGPEMTVKSYNTVDNHQVYCVWFSEKGLDGATFDDRTLDYAQEDPSSA